MNSIFKFILGTLLGFYISSHKIQASNASRCVTQCNQHTCSTNSQLANYCVVWCQGLHQYQDRLTTCVKYAPTSKAALRQKEEELRQREEALKKKEAGLANKALAQQNTPAPVIPAPQKSEPTFLHDPHHATELKKKEDEIKKLKAMMDQLNRQLTQSKSAGKSQDETLKKETENFKIKYARGKIPLKETMDLLRDMDQVNDEISARDFLLFLEQGLDSSDEARKESIYEILDFGETVKIIKDIRASQESDANSALITQFKEEGSKVYEAEKNTLQQQAEKGIKNFNQTKNNSELIKIVPSSVFLLIPAGNMSKIDQSRLIELTRYMEFTSLNQRKALFSMLLDPSLIKNPEATLKKPSTFAQKLFLAIFQSIKDGKEKKFSPPTDKASRVKLEGLNLYLLRLTSLSNQLVGDNASQSQTSQGTTTPPGKIPPPPPGKMPPPPPGKMPSSPPPGKPPATQTTGTAGGIETGTIVKLANGEWGVKYKEGRMPVKTPIAGNAPIIDKSGQATTLKENDNVSFDKKTIQALDRTIFGTKITGQIKVTNR